MQRFTEYDSPIGQITIASDGEAICGLWFSKHKYKEQTLGSDAVHADDEVLRQLAAWLDAYFAKRRPAIDELSLAPVGSEFRQSVWRALCSIPYGQTASYGEIAQEVAKERGKASPRSVGGAVGHNPISIVIPCHRVVGANGSLTGYGGGMANKIALLEHEGLDMSRFTVPTKGTAL